MNVGDDLGREGEHRHQGQADWSGDPSPLVPSRKTHSNLPNCLDPPLPELSSEDQSHPQRCEVQGHWEESLVTTEYKADPTPDLHSLRASANSHTQTPGFTNH